MTLTKKLSIFFPIFIFIGIIFSYRNFLPIWDSREYLSVCILPAVSHPFQLMSFNCSNHNAIFFGLLYGLTQYLVYGNMYLVHFMSVILVLVGFLFYYLILKYFIQQRIWLVLGLALLAWHPILLANTLNPSPDLMIFVFSILCLWCFITNRIQYAPWIGLVLFFTKESGVMYYSFCCLLYAVIYFRKFWESRAKWLLLLPYAAYASFIWYKTQIAGASIFFNDISADYIWKHLIKTNWKYGYIYSVMSSIFIVNFQWLMTGIILCGAIIWLCDGKKYWFSHKKIKEILFIALLVLFLCYFLTRFPHFTNPRYYLLIFPLLNILFILVLKKYLKTVGLWFGFIFSMLLLISCFRTVDPMSRALYGVFNFGNHSLLNTVSINRECCGYGRDQLVYNLEYTQIQTILEKFSQKVQLKKNDILLTEHTANFFIAANLASDYRWTLNNRNTHRPYFVDNFLYLTMLQHSQPIGRMFYLQLPNASIDFMKQNLLQRYKILQTISLNHHGYRVDFIEFDKRNTL